MNSETAWNSTKIEDIPRSFKNIEKIRCGNHKLIILLVTIIILSVCQQSVAASANQNDLKSIPVTNSKAKNVDKIKKTNCFTVSKFLVNKKIN